MKFFFIIFLLVNFAQAALPSRKSFKINYQTEIGHCPQRVAGEVSLLLVKEFERNFSLKDVKEKIVKEKLMERYYLGSYKLGYDPLSKLLKLRFDCAQALMRVQMYKRGSDETFTAVLGTDGKLYEPGFETMLRKEGKITFNLPSLALPLEEMDKNAQHEITKAIAQLSRDYRNHLSEVIYDNKKELTLIFSYENRPTSIFLGLDEWELKIQKVEKILEYMESKKKLPTVVNLTNLKKVVVKF